MLKPLVAALILLAPHPAAGSFAADPKRGGASSAQELCALFWRHAAAHDLAGLHALVFAGADGEPDWKLFDRMVQQGFQYELLSVELKELEKGEVLEYSANGVEYRPTLAPIGRLVVKYDPRSSDPGAPAREVTVRNMEISFLVGVDAGRFYITFASPVRP